MKFSLSQPGVGPGLFEGGGGGGREETCSPRGDPVKLPQLTRLSLPQRGQTCSRGMWEEEEERGVVLSLRSKMY